MFAVQATRKGVTLSVAASATNVALPTNSQDLFRLFNAGPAIVYVITGNSASSPPTADNTCAPIAIGGELWIKRGSTHNTLYAIGSAAGPSLLSISPATTQD